MFDKIRLPTLPLSPLLKGSLFYLGYYGSMGIFVPFINVYWSQELGFSGRQIGLLSILRPLTMLLVAIPVAALADRRHWRIPLLIGALTSGSLVFLLVGSFYTFPAWMVGALLMAITLSSASPLSDSLIARMALRHQVNYGTMRLGGSVGFALMAICGGSIWDRIGLTMLFPLTGLALLPVVFFASQLEEQSVGSTRHAGPSFWTILKADRGLIVLIITSFFMGAGLNFCIIFDGMYMKWVGGTEVLIGLMFSLTAVSELPGMHYRDRLATRLGGPAMLLLGYSLFLLAFVGYIFVSQPWMLLVIASVRGLGFGLCWVSTVRLSSERVPEQWISTVQSVISASAFGVAPLLASPLGGELYDRFGPRAVFLCAAVLVSGAVIVFAVALAKNVFTKGN